MAKKTEIKKTESFEGKMRRLEEIVESLESGEQPLDAVVGMFEEGIRLSTECLEYLGKTELRLKKLSRDAAGKFELTSEEDEG
jgi:exodeoxyribonuclease VII small subunit